MKKILAVLLLVTATFASCTKEEQEKKKDWVTVDFTGASGHSTLTFIGEQGQGTYTFDSDNGLVQSQKLYFAGTYTLQWQIVSVPQVTSCQFQLEVNGLQYYLPEAPGSKTLTGVTLQTDYGFSINCR